MGINAPREHQRIIRNLIFNLTNQLLHQSYDALPDSSMDADDHFSKCPDVLIEHDVNGSIPVIIEVTGKGGVKKDKKEIAELFLENEEQLYGLLEGFVFDYDTNKWHKITAETESSYSDSLQIDLSGLTQLNR